MMLSKRDRRIKNVLYVLCFAFFIIWSIGPIVWSFVISITPSALTMLSPAPLWPAEITWENYAALLPGSTAQEQQFFQTGILNSLRSCAITLLIGVPICVLCGYSLARISFRGRKALNVLLRATMVIPVFTVIVPVFKIYTNVGLTDNDFGLAAVYISAFMPLAIWLLQNHFSSLPVALEEAAALDGCSPLQTLARIILPISYPMVFAVMLIMVISTWNQYFIPLILAPSMATKPIAVVISEFVTKNSVNYGLMNAGGLLAILPPVLIALIFRKFLVSGLSSGAVKG